MNAPTPPKRGGPPKKPARPGAGAGPKNSGATAQDKAVPGKPGQKNLPPAKRPGTGLTPAKKPVTPVTLKPQTTLPAAAQTPTPEKPAPVRPVAVESRFKFRHLMVLLSFLMMVVAPTAVAAWYLWTRAADQYASTVAFSVRKEENASAITSLLGPLDLSGSTTSDSDILYEFIQSQNLVARIDSQLDLRSIWAKADPAVDPVFAYHPPGTIEDLLAHWERMVRIYYDSGTGLMELKALAFTPEDAKSIAEAIYSESTAMINELSAIAREDAIGYARDELNQAVERLKTAREAVTTFRNRTQIIDPSMDLQGQAGLLSTLNQQLAEALIALDLLRQTTRAGDPRIAQAELTIEVIEKRIEEEKQKLGIADSGNADGAFATLVGEFERLAVDREFAEQTYTAALAAYDAAQAEARRQSRYLAAHVRPTFAERAEYPQRGTILGLMTLFLFLSWTVLVLVAYSLRDRR